MTQRNAECRHAVVATRAFGGQPLIGVVITHLLRHKKIYCRSAVIELYRKPLIAK